MFWKTLEERRVGLVFSTSFLFDFKSLFGKMSASVQNSIFVLCANLNVVSCAFGISILIWDFQWKIIAVYIWSIYHDLIPELWLFDPKIEIVKKLWFRNTDWTLDSNKFCHKWSSTEAGGTKSWDLRKFFFLVLLLRSPEMYSSLIGLFCIRKYRV